MTHIDQAPSLTRIEIIRAAEKLTDGYHREVGEDSRLLGINFQSVYENYIYPNYETEFIDNELLGIDEYGEKILGMYEPFNNIIRVCSSLRDDPRRAFTCWHELGHAILHGDWLQFRCNLNGTPSPIVSTEISISDRAEQKMERQANLFAAHAAAPKHLIDMMIRRLLKLERPIRFVRPGSYALEGHGRSVTYEIHSSFDLCMRMAAVIQHRFGGLSVESLA